MDTFIDKLAQKTIANDMINANAAAEARENQKMLEQLSGYETILQEMKQVSLKNIESASKVTEMLEGIDLTKESQASAGISPEDMEELKSSLNGKADEIVRAGEDTANSVKYAAEDAVLSVKMTAEDAVKNVKVAVDDVVVEMKTSSQEAVMSVKTAGEEAVELVAKSTEDIKQTAQDSAADIKQTAETSAADIKQAAQDSAADIKQITEAGVEDMKQASAESVESMKQASIEATETIKQAVEEGLEAIKGASADVVKGDAPQMDQTYLNAQFDDVHDAIHTENVKVYRNVQAAVDDSLADQTKAIRGYIERTQKEGSKLPLVLGIVNFALNIIILAVLILTAMGVF